jgi:hypothetical protein
MNAAEPIPVIPLEYAKPTTLPRRRRWVLAAQLALLLSAADVAVGLALIALVDAETVLATAPILFAAGLVLLVASWRVELLLTTMLGLTHCAICLFFTTLVNVRNWSPREATLPFTVMGGAYLVAVTLPVTCVGFVRLRAMMAGTASGSPAPATGGALPSTARLAKDTA